MDKIEVRGARTHNSKNINPVIPATNRIVVTGLSGSGGKPHWLRHTLYAEGQRRYVESFPLTRAAVFVAHGKTDVDHIRPSPAIHLPNRNDIAQPALYGGRSLPRSTTTCACCFARGRAALSGIMTCRWRRKTVSQMVDNVPSQPKATSDAAGADY